MAQVLTDMFPGRLQVIFGDSRQSIVQFHHQNPSVTCDLIVIDGGHGKGIPMSDFHSLRKMVNFSSTHLLVVDDCPTRRDHGEHGGVLSMWDQVTKSGQAETIKQCILDHLTRGVTLGKYFRTTA